MFRRLAFLFVILWIGVLANSANSENYFYLTNTEETVFGEHACFFGGDTIWGTMRSNDAFCFIDCPVIYGQVITTASEFWDPLPFCDVNVYFNAPFLPWPDSASNIREWAAEQGNFFDVNENVHARIRILDHTLRITWAVEGTPFDTTEFETYPLADSSVVFLDCPVQLSGTVSGVLIFGASGDIGLETDIRYACMGDSGIGYFIQGDCPDKLAIVSEGSIYIMNTVANGRDNSNGLGNGQSNQNFTSIVITAYLAALGTNLTFDQQNDIGDPYQGPYPDNRGRIHLNGGIMQRNRGYVHRSNHGSTGYLKDYHWDGRMANWDFGLNFGTPQSVLITPTSLNFGEVTVGDTGYADIQVEDFAGFIEVDSLTISSPFFVDTVTNITHGQRFTVGFAPSHIGQFSSALFFFLSSFWLSAPLHGEGIPPLDADDAILPNVFSLSAYPNPFNASTTIHYGLPSAGFVSISILDITGRLTDILSRDVQTAGEHSILWTPANLASGVYFCKVETANGRALQKLVLLK